MYHYLFYFLFSYYNQGKWKEQNFPYLSTVIAIGALLMLNFITLRDLFMFQIYDVRYHYFEYDALIIPTIFLGFNYFYFKRKGLYRKILSQFKAKTKEEKRFYWIASWIYIIITVVSVVTMGYSVRNNIKWW